MALGKWLWRHFVKTMNNEMGINPAIIAALISAAGSMGSQAMANSGREDQESGYDIVEMPEYPWARGNQEQVSQYYQNMLNELSRGEQPDYMKYLDPMAMNAKQNLSETMYGTAGRPGTLRDTFGMGSISGVGPKGAMSSGMSHVADYMTEGRKIDDFFNQIKANEMSRLSTTVPQQMSNMPRGPESQIVPYGGGGGQKSGGGFDYGKVASSIPWESMFNQGAPQGQVQTGYTDYGNNMPTGTYAPSNKDGGYWEQSSLDNYFSQ